METTPRLGLKKLLEDRSDPVSAYRQAINANAAALESLDFGQQDFHQAGVVASTDWEMSANIVGGTGELGSVANTGGTAWLTDPVIAGALMRTATAAAKLAGLKPPSLPAAGKYMNVGIQLAAKEDGWGASATVSVVSGESKGTQKEAEEHPAAAVAGKTRIRDVIIHNEGGVYSIVAQRDRRPWATGACYVATGPEEANLESTAAVLIPFTQVRLECTGAPVRIELMGRVVSTAGWQIWAQMDSTAPETGWIGKSSWLSGYIGETTFNLSVNVTPSAGSHLFVCGMRSTTAGKNLTLLNNGAASQGLPQFAIRELLHGSRNNGTS